MAAHGQVTGIQAGRSIAIERDRAGVINPVHHELHVTRGRGRAGSSGAHRGRESDRRAIGAGVGGTCQFGGGEAGDDVQDKAGR